MVWHYWVAVLHQPVDGSVGVKLSKHLFHPCTATNNRMLPAYDLSFGVLLFWDKHGSNIATANIFLQCAGHAGGKVS